MQFASSEVAKLPRLALVPLSLARIRRGTHIQSAPAATAKYTPTDSNARTDKSRNTFTFLDAMVLPALLVKIFTEKEWKDLPGVAPEQQPPHCNGRQWMKPSFSPPLLSHFGCRHRRGDSDRFAWKKPFRFVRGGVGSGDAERLSTAAAAAAAAIQQHQAPFQRENKRSSMRMKITLHHQLLVSIVVSTF